MGNFHIKYISLIIFLFISCNAYKIGFYNELQGDNSYLNNIIIDYFEHSKYIRKYQTFNITLEKEDTAAYYYYILPENDHWTASIENPIGSIPISFPTHYKEYKDKLFLWNDKAKPLSHGVLDKMKEYNVLDSFWLKINLGMIDEMKLKKEDYPIEIYDDGLKATYYLIPKNNLNHFKRCKKMEKCKL